MVAILRDYGGEVLRNSHLEEGRLRKMLASKYVCGLRKKATSVGPRAKLVVESLLTWALKISFALA